MCGIAGMYLREGRASESLLRDMCAAIRHRGPDDEGVLADGRCGLGMRRLSIIDVEGGHQPISNEDGTIWLVFNGEIYNFHSLADDLAAKGHRFRTRSDTETIVHLYEEIGVEVFSRLRGMFAIAIWDGRRQRLVLGRDRFGKKPVYIARLDDGLYFASELPALRVAGIPLEIDREAIKLYFRFSWIPDPYTGFRHVRRLPAASWMTIDADGRTEEGRYWTLPRMGVPEPSVPAEASALATELRRRFDEAVRIRMISDVPLGAFLSGGLDSSSVVASMALQSDAPVKTFSIGFAEAGFNELPYARLVADRYKTEHHDILVQPDSVALVEKLARHFGEPFGDESAIPTHIVSEFAASHVKVALSGDGGDELFGGYDSFFATERQRPLDRIPGLARRALGVVADALPYSAYGKNLLRMASRGTALERYFESTYAPQFLLERLLNDGWAPPADESYFLSRFGGALSPRHGDILSDVMYFEATAKLTGDMLVKVDRASMAASLEVRCPLLDHVLADLAMAIPNALKVAKGKGKRILIEALGDRLPPELLSRPKMGFGVPLAAWFRGGLRPYLRDHLTGEARLTQEIASPAFVSALIDEHERGRRDNSHWLWSLLMMELWLRGLS